MNPDQYIVVVNGKPQGPYTLTDLKALNIQSNTFVKKPGMDDYKEAHAIPELRELLGFSYQKTAPQYFASFDQRLLASIIDYFFILSIYLLVFLIALMLYNNDKPGVIQHALLFLPLIPIIKFLYGSFAEATAKQGTIGKRLLSIKVTDLVGNPISIGKSFGRNFSKILSVIPAFFGYLYCFLNKKNQCWHDIAANTLVIKDRLI